MRYMFLVTRSQSLAKSSEYERNAVLEKIVQWWGQQYASGKIVEGGQLQSPETATTVVIDHGKHTLLKQPLMEANEAIGGFGIMETADLDEALGIVESMPSPDCKVEVRPIVEIPH